MFSLRDDITYFEVSALTGENVESLFDSIASKLKNEPINSNKKEGRLSYDLNEQRSSVMKEGGEVINLNEQSKGKKEEPAVLVVEQI